MCIRDRCNTNLLWLKVNSTSIQTFEYDIYAALVLDWFVLPDNGRMNNTIIKTPPILNI